MRCANTGWAVVAIVIEVDTVGGRGGLVVFGVVLVDRHF